MNRIFSFVVLLAIAFCGAHVKAQPIAAAGKLIWGIAASGKQTEVAAGAELAALIKARPYSKVDSQGASELATLLAKPSTAGVDDAITVGASGTIPVGSKGVPVTVSGSVAKEALVSGVAGCLTGGVVGCVIGAATPLALNWIASAGSGFRLNPGTGQLERGDPVKCTTAPCYSYSVGRANSWPSEPVLYPWYPDPESACPVGYKFNQPNGTNTIMLLGAAPRPLDGTISCIYKFWSGYNADTSRPFTLASNGYPFAKQSRSPDSEGSWLPASMDDIAPYMKTPDPGVVDELAQKGVKFQVDGIKLTGPMSTDGKQVTKVNPDGSKSVTTTKTDYSYDGAKVREGDTTDTTVTTKPDGSQETTTKTITPTTQLPAPDPSQNPSQQQTDDTPPTDSPLPPVPDLYQRKYPDGMVGIWNNYKDQMKSAPLVALIGKLMPNVGDGGSCPTWPINLDLADWASYGVHDVAPPCGIWDVAKAILILSALLLARSLIFGG